MRRILVALASAALALAVSTLGHVAAQSAGLLNAHQAVNVQCAACHQEGWHPPPATVCIACHGTMLDGVRETPGPDPHRSPHLAADEAPVCTECHAAHGPSEVTCNACHRSFRFGTN